MKIQERREELRKRKDKGRDGFRKVGRQEDKM